MASLLAKQLQRYSTLHSLDGGNEGTLLHDAKSAKHFTPEESFHVGLEGFEALCDMDERFARFRDLLFSGVPAEREKKTQEEIERTNAAITNFLRLLTDYFTDPPAIKALEHLLRNYRVHVFNVDDCVECALVYHSTVEFQRLLSLLKIKGSRWHWLRDVQKSKLPLPRDVIVQRCLVDQSLLSFVCEMAKRSSETDLCNDRVLPFFAVLVCEVLQKSEEVTEKLMRCLMSVVAAGLRADASANFRQATLIIIVQLATRASLRKEALTALLKSLLATRSEKESVQLTTIICHMYSTQKHFTKVPDEVLKMLCGMADLKTVLASLIQKGLNARPFVAALCKKLTKKITHASSSVAADLLEGLIHDIPLESEVQEIVVSLLDASPEASGPVLRAVDLRYPVLLDAAVNTFLRTEEDLEKRERVLLLLHGLPNSGLHSELEGKQVTVLAAADAPDPRVRKTAMEQLKNRPELWNRTGVDEVLSGVLLRRLVDEDFEVAAAAVMVYEAAIFADNSFAMDALLQLLKRAMAKLKDRDPNAEACADKALAGLFLTVSSVSCTGQSERILFDVIVLMFPLCQEQLPICLRVAEGIGRFPHPVAQSLRGHLHSRLPLLQSLFDPQEFQKTVVLALTGLLSESDVGCVYVGKMFEHGSQELSGFLCSAIRQKALAHPTEIDQRSLLGWLIGQLRQDVSEIQTADMPHRGSARVLLLTLTAVLCSLKTRHERLEMELGSVHEMLGLILEREKADRKRKCAKALLEAFGGDHKLLFLLTFLLSVPPDESPSLLQKGLWLFRSCIEDGVQEGEETVCCVVPLGVLMSHAEESVRGAALRASQKLLSTLSAHPSALASAVSVLLQYVKEHEAAVKADRDCLQTLLKDFLSASNSETRVSKKQKTLKEHAHASGSAACLCQYFSEQLQCLDVRTETRQLLLIFRCLNGVINHADLLKSAMSLLAKSVKTESTPKIAELARQLIGAFQSGPLIGLPDPVQQKVALELLEQCLNPGADAGIKMAVMRLMTPKWMAAADDIDGHCLVDCLLRCSNVDQDTAIAREAEAILMKWPLRLSKVEAALQPALDRGAPQISDQGGEQQQCLWMLELLAARKRLPGDVNVVRCIEELLRQILRFFPTIDGVSDTLMRICRAAFVLLETAVQKGAETSESVELNTDLLLSYVQWSGDSILQSSVLSLLQCTSSSAPSEMLWHVLEVLKETLNRPETSENLQQRQKAAETVTAVLKIWAQSRQQMQEAWHITFQGMKQLAPQERLFVLQIVLDGTAQDRSLSICSALWILLDEQSEWELSTDVALELCQLVDLSERNGALALIMKQVQDESPATVPSNLCLRLVKFVLSALKTSATDDGECRVSLHGTRHLSCGDGSGFGLILIQTIRMLNLFDQTPVNVAGDNSKVAAAVQRNLRDLLSFLNRRMDLDSCLVALSHVIQTTEGPHQLLALEIFQKKLQDQLQKWEQKQWTLPSMLCELPAFLFSAKQQNEGQSPEALQLILSTTQHLVHAHGAQDAEPFMQWTPVIAQYMEHADPHVRGSALACMAAFLRELGEATLEHLPTFMPSVLKSLDSCLEGDIAMDETASEALDLVSGLALIEALVEGMGMYLSPYLTQILRILFNPKIPNAPFVEDLMDSVLSLLPKNVAGRLLLPELLEAFEWLGKDSTLSLCRYARVLNAALSVLNASAVGHYLQQVAAFFLKVLDLRRLDALKVSEILSVETALIQAFQSFVMKLNAEQFKPVLDGILDWMFQEPSCLSRHVTGFHLLSDLTERLKALFVGYLPAFVDMALDLVVTDVGKKPWSKANLTPPRQQQYLMKYFILQCLCRGLLYDEDDILNQPSMETILAAAIYLLKKTSRPSVLFLQDLGQLEDKALLKFKGSELYAADPLSLGLATLLIELGGEATMQKIVVHKVLKCCLRHGSDYTQVLSLCIVREVVFQSKEEFTPLIPETVPKLAEFLESTDPTVTSLSRDLLALCREITGESLEQQMQP